jgi:hypothetical protein
MPNNVVYASYNGSQVGFTVRNFALDQLSFHNIGINANGIAAGPNDDVYLVAANHIYHYGANGQLIKDMTFPIATINYTGVVVKGNRVYACYQGSQQGVTVRDLALNQLSFFNTGVNASGIAAGPNDDVYITAANHIINYKTNGTLIKDMTFPIATINYTDVTILGSKVYASYNGSQQGFTVRDLGLNQLSFVAIASNIKSIAAGPNSDVYMASANHLLDYKVSGQLIKDMTFPITTINYTGVAVTFTTLT